MTSKPNISIGWPLLPLPDSGGRLRFPVDLDESVQQSLRVILTTRRGELLLHPDFGAGLGSFLHDLDTVVLRQQIHERIVESLARYEPRIDVDRVEISEMPAPPPRLKVQIAYRLRRTGAAGSVGLTLTTGA